MGNNLCLDESNVALLVRVWEKMKNIGRETHGKRLSKTKTLIETRVYIQRIL